VSTLESSVQVSHPRRPIFRLERAELLKLRKSRGVWIPTALSRSSDRNHVHGGRTLPRLQLEQVRAAGGTVNLGHALLLMGQVAGMIAAALVGAAAGTQDLSSGVFRISSRPGAREHDCSWRGFRAGWRCYCR